MLTRLEVHGFKNLVNFAVDLGPFTCIAGKNASGKSNVFDAIQFLSLLATEPLMEAAQRVRRSGDERTGDPRDIFTAASDRRFESMRLAAEMVVQPTVEDDLGESANATTTFLRYELEIGYEEPTGAQRTGRMVLLREDLKHINIGEALEHLPFPHSASRFRKAIVRGRRFGSAFISTNATPTTSPVIRIHGDAGSRGNPRPASAARARATVLSTVTTVGDPTILAAKREMSNWRRLALEPSALRAADDYSDPHEIGDDGRHLPGALARLAQQRVDLELDSDVEQVYGRIASRLEALDGIEVNQLWVDDDRSPRSMLKSSSTWNSYRFYECGTTSSSVRAGQT